MQPEERQSNLTLKIGNWPQADSFGFCLHCGMKNEKLVANNAEGFNIVWKVKPKVKNKPEGFRKYWPRLRVVDNQFVAYAETRGV